MSASPCPICDEPLCRTRYVPAMLLTSEDMRLEQEFGLKKLRRHNRYLHGFGVACGLEVRLPPDVENENQRGTRVWVCPGYAVSPEGDDILLDEPVLFDLATCAQEPDPCCQPWPCPPVGTPPGSTSTDGLTIALWLVIRYAECLTRPVRIPATGCGCDATSCDYSRICESFELKCLRTQPESHRIGRERDLEWQSRFRAWRESLPQNPRAPLPTPRCPPCPEDPWVVLARVVLSRGDRGSLNIVAIDEGERRVLLSTTALQLLHLP
jgi:hypothetical protein